jgi:hypothetical protein
VYRPNQRVAALHRNARLFQFAAFNPLELDPCGRCRAASNCCDAMPVLSGSIRPKSPYPFEAVSSEWEIVSHSRQQVFDFEGGR